MEALATILSYASGFALMGYREAPAELIATSLVVDAALAPLTALIAARHGRSSRLWASIGFLFGMWALFAALLMRSSQSPSKPPPTSGFSPSSDAA